MRAAASRSDRQGDRRQAEPQGRSLGVKEARARPPHPAPWGCLTTVQAQGCHLQNGNSLGQEGGPGHSGDSSALAVPPPSWAGGKASGPGRSLKSWALEEEAHWGGFSRPPPKPGPKRAWRGLACLKDMTLPKPWVGWGPSGHGDSPGHCACYCLAGT